MSKQFWGILIAIVVIFGGIVFVTNHKNSDLAPSNAKPTSHIQGEGKSGVTLIEYGDYECPVCQGFYQAVKDTAAKYNAEIYFQFRNLPLTSLHHNAFAAARAAEAAGLQGKYFEMHDLLYEGQDPSGNGGWVAQSETDPLNHYFVVYAKQLKLDVAKFKADYASQKVNNAINADLAAFKKTGDQQATPTFYLDGKKLNNNDLSDPTTGPNVAAFSKVIDAEIAAKAKESSTTSQTQ